MLTSSRAAQRRDPRWWALPHAPSVLRRLDDDGAGRGSAEGGAGGSVGRGSLGRGGVGLLDMEFAVVAGATRAVRHFHRTPIYVLQPIHLDPARPDMAFVYLQQQGDGFVQGDRHRLDLEVGERAALHLTTQAATKVYGMDHGYATQVVNLNAGAGSLLEYLPDPVIPFRGSRFVGATTVTADPDATVMFAETLLPGRVARGEWHDYDLFHTTTRVRRPDGRQVAVDTLSFEGAGRRADSPAGLGRHGVHATFFVLAPAGRLEGLQPALLARLELCTDVLTGVTLLPFEAGLLVRVLGASSIPVRAATHAAWDVARRHVVGAPAPDLRKD